MVPREHIPLERNPLWAQVVKILKQHTTGSYATRRHRADALKYICDYLFNKYKVQNIRNLKTKHVQNLVTHWKGQGAQDRSIANKLSHIRWLMNSIGKGKELPATNEKFGIKAGEAARYTRAGKFVSVENFNDVVSKLSDERLQLMAELGRHLGMRFEEASLFRPNRDVAGDKVYINRGTKGGRARYIRITNEKQKEVIQKLRSVIKSRDGCLVSGSKTFKSWKARAYRHFEKAGISRKSDVEFHDLRRTFANDEMNRLVKYFTAKGLAREETIERASQIVSKEMGHSRLDIIHWYIAGSAK